MAAAALGASGCSLGPLEAVVTPRWVPPVECDARLSMAEDARLGDVATCPAERELPSSVEQARAHEHERLERVVHAWTASFGGRWYDFGDFEREATRTGLRKLMAGLKALELFEPADPLRPPADFPARAQDWLVKEARMYRRAGTDTSLSPVGGSQGDYDFTMLQILELIYHFKSRPELLGNDAIWALLENERFQVRRGRGRRSATRIPEVGNWPHRMTFHVLAEFPETENHVLMVNTWAYLVNQWLEHDYRGDPRVRAYFRRQPDSYRNEGSFLERVLLSVLSRPLHSGFFETNARPYNAYSLRALQLLYSYADDSRPGGRRVKLAARNALDYAAATFAFQSFQGKRLGPSRRNYRYRNLLGVYASDYVPFVFGVLTGAHVYDDDPLARGERAVYTNTQARGFALESALSKYRVPEPIWDFMLNPDGHQPGFGVWVRMQARFSERHYLQGKWPRYPGRSPRLEQAMREGLSAVEPAPELYFITKGYMNSAGGRGEHYAGMDGWLPAALHHTNDLMAKPSVLLLPGDVGHWQSWSALADQTLAFRGDTSEPWSSNNTGVYKNLVYGYATDGVAWPFSLPERWRTSHPSELGALSLRVVDLSRTNRQDNPELGLYLVLGRFRRLLPGAAMTGFWEVIPEAHFDDARAVMSSVLSRNAGRVFAHGGPYDYSLCLSGDELRFNPRFSRDQNPFLRINGASERVELEHVNPHDRAALARQPLLEVQEVDARYRNTGVVLAFAAGDGRLRLDNAHLGVRLLLDSSDPAEPRRRLVPLPGVPLRSGALAGFR